MVLILRTEVSENRWIKQNKHIKKEETNAQDLHVNVCLVYTL